MSRPPRQTNNAVDTDDPASGTVRLEGEPRLQRSGRVGKAYLVGAGPGDPSLITVRGAEILGRADVLLVDGLVNPDLRKYASPNAEWISVGKHGGPRLWKQHEIDDALVGYAQAGKTVVRLKGGDTGVFARTAEELQRLTREGIPFEVVPGITAALASAAYTGIPLTHRDWSSAVALVTGQMQAADGGPEVDEPIDWVGLAKFPGTLVVYMGVTTAPIWSRRLIEAGRGPSTPVAIVRRCSWTDQKVVRCRLDEVANHLGSHSKLRPPVLAVIGDVAALGEQHDWFTQRPLFGKTILVARPEGQADSTLKQLTDLGAYVLHQPMVKLVPPKDFSQLDKWINDCHRFDWLIFSSANGVDFFFRRFHELGMDGRAMHRCRIAGVGPSVAEALSRWHLHCDHVPSGDKPTWNAALLAESLTAKWQAEKLPPQNCLVVRPDRGKTILESHLSSAGHPTEVAVAYWSLDVESLDPLVQQAVDTLSIDTVLVTSSKIASNLIRLSQGRLGDTLWIAISEEVAEIVRQSGASQVLVSEYAGLDSMIERLLGAQ